MVKKLVLTLTAVLLFCVSALAQNRSVSGTVTDADGNPVFGAVVIIEGTSQGVTTDAKGHYTINVPANASLRITSMGFEDQLVVVNNRSVIDFVMNEDNELIDEVTVVAFGTKRKQDLVGSVSTVSSSIIQNSQAASVSNALEGAVAGLQVISSTGQPGADASIYVRGIGSLSASNQALIVVDGVPFNGKLSDINPADIQSINVSKDAVSNSLYGSRAAGGVVLVTTKTGSRDRVSIQFQATMGVSQRAYKDYDMVTDPGEFYELTWYGLRNTAWASQDPSAFSNNAERLAAAADVASSSLLSELGNYNSFIIPDGEFLVGLDGKLNKNAKFRYKDTFADAMFDSAVRKEYTASASGGNDRTDYYLSIGYLDNDSYIIGSDYQRTTGRVNVNSQLRKWVKVGTNLAYSTTVQNGSQESTTAASNPFKVARSWAPIYPVYARDAQGNVILDSSGKPMYDAGTGQTAGTVSRPTATNSNVICNLWEDIRESKYNNITTRSYVEFTFLRDFKATANYSYDYSNMDGTTYYTPTIGDGQSFGGRGTKSSSNSATVNFNQILSYEKPVSDGHNISAKLGHEYYTYRGSSFSGQKTQFFDPFNPELNNGGMLQYINSYTIAHNIEGFFGMFDYNYAHKYYLSGAFRRDGTSRFLKKWGNFWSVGAAWRVTAENFMQNQNWLNDLKLRVSYGTQGNEDILSGSAYAYTPYVDQYEITWDGSSLGYTPVFYGNPDLSWETQKTFDVGLSFQLFDKLSGSAEYFIRTTDDMLFQRPLAFSTGARPYKWENIGSMVNNGVEFELNYDIIEKKDFRWTVSLVGSHYNNKILTLPDENKEDGITSGTFKLMEGKSRYEYFTYKFAGISETGVSTWYKEVTDENGDVTLETTETYSEATKMFLGKTALPDFNGGLNTSLYFKGFDLSIATAFQVGGWGYDSNFLDGMSASFYVGHNSAMWSTYNPETGAGEYPVWNANNSSNSFTQTSSLNLIDASYFSIRNLTLGYTIPQAWSKGLGINSLRVFFTADNLALWSKRQGFDPRVSMSGGNSGFSGYAPLRVLSGGINLSF